MKRRDWVIWWLICGLLRFASKEYAEGVLEGFDHVMGGRSWRDE